MAGASTGQVCGCTLPVEPHHHSRTAVRPGPDALAPAHCAAG
ncbi:hypothetical protein [Streptomyces sp. NPDC059072]